MFGIGKKGEAVVEEKDVLAALGRIQDPDLRRDIVSLGFIKDLQIERERVSFKIELTTPACPVKGEMERMAREYVGALPGVEKVEVSMTSQVRSTAPPSMGLTLPGVRNVIAVASGKGGVGKSTVAANLAVALGRSGARVGLLDADVYGPSIPGLMGLQDHQPVVKQKPGSTDADDQVFDPPLAHGVKVNSFGFLLEEPTQPVIYRGPMIASAIKQLLTQTDWGELDYLIVDLPPGTGDATLTLAQSIPLSGVIIVSQPQEVALQIAVKALKAFQTLKVKVLGIVENMSYFVCDQCDKRHDIFSHGGARKAAEKYEVPFLGEIPLSTDVRESSDSGTPVVQLKPDSVQSKAFTDIAQALAAQVSIGAFAQRKVIPLRAV
jgi:ATP-binding protein involved in chromosome partitioning